VSLLDRRQQVPLLTVHLVAVRTADLNRPYVKDIANAYRSTDFKRVIDERFTGFLKP